MRNKKHNASGGCKKVIKRTLATVITCSMMFGLVQAGPSVCQAQENMSSRLAGSESINNDDWLHVEGSDIKDKNGNVVRLVGVNWFGYNCCEEILHGLGWGVNMSKVLKECADRGINLIRVPVSTQLLLEWENGQAKKPDTPYNCDGFNMELVHEDGTCFDNLEVFDAFLEMCRENGIKVMVDVHSAESNNAGHNYPLWYNDGAGITTEDWIEGWEWLVRRYKDDDTIIAVDLENEPHGKVDEGDFAKWDDSQDINNWKYAAERCAKAILDINPNLLIMVEGIEMNPKKGCTYDSDRGKDWSAGGVYYNYEGAWWGGNLRMAKQYPIDLGSSDRNAQVVYSPHDYGPLVYAQEWFDKDFTEQTLLDDYWYDAWAYLVEEGKAPLLMGEWGGFMDGGDNEKWMNILANYMNKMNISHTFWCLNPNSGDTGGLLTDDWKNWDEEKYALFETTLWKDENGRYVGLDHEKGLGTEGITIDEYYNGNAKPVVKVTGVEISEDTLSLAMNQKADLKAEVKPENATNQKVMWTTDNASVVSVTKDGVVTAVGYGKAVVTVTTSDGNKTATCEVTVSAEATENPTTERETTGEATTERATTERETTEEATAERATTERATTERATTERATTERATTERATTERATTERETTEEATTERETTEEATTERVTTERATTERATTERATTERETTEEATTERATTERATTERATTERATTERATTERATTERATTERATTERATTERATTERATTERATTERETTEEATTERATTERTTTQRPDEGNSTVEETTTENVFDQKPGTDNSTTEKSNVKGTEEKTVTGIKLETDTEITLAVNKAKVLDAQVIPTDADNKQLSYATSDAGVADVSANGIISAISPGIAEITITSANNIQVKVKVTVTPQKVSGLKKNVKTSSAKLMWKKQKNVTGYKVYRYSNGKYRLYKTTKKNYINVTKLKGGTTYKFKIRAYKTVHFKAVYGDYSSTIKVKAKR